jgi:hypothetical protein
LSSRWKAISKRIALLGIEKGGLFFKIYDDFKFLEAMNNLTAHQWFDFFSEKGKCKLTCING